MKRAYHALLAISLLLGCFGTAISAQTSGPRYALALYGEPALPEDFQHFPYADPRARKGGRLVIGLQGTFDSLNPFIIKGIAPQHVRGYVVQSLMARSLDEPFTIYPQIAKAIERAPDGSSVTFYLDERARFSDGEQVTSADVQFSFETLKAKGRPDSRYRKVSAVTLLGPHAVRFELTDTSDRELPLILGLTPVLQKSKTDGARFDETTLKPIPGSGPYVVADIQPGQSFTLRRNPDYWAKDLPTSRGLYNFDEIKVEFYRDSNALFEAFKAGLFDVRIEDNPNQWANAYDFPAIRDGRIRRESLPLRTARGMTGFILNTRRPIFEDVRVREAFSLLFDFEWVNRNLFLDAYARIDSYFAGSELASTGIPASQRERQWLAEFPNAVRPDVLEGKWTPVATDGSGRDRNLFRRAVTLLDEAGWAIVEGKLRHKQSGAVADFETLVTTRPQERLALIFARSLRQIGVNMRVRLADDSQYWKRIQDGDFDATIFGYQPTASPGNEQAGRWSSEAAGRRSLNLAGVRNPAIDAAIRRIVEAKALDEYVDAVRMLDRLLISGHYVIPLYFLKDQLFAYRVGLQRPERLPKTGLALETLWWEAR